MTEQQAQQLIERLDIDRTYGADSIYHNSLSSADANLSAAILPIPAVSQLPDHYLHHR
jgi:hypothetical protein